jgi:hypothetical protein
LEKKRYKINSDTINEGVEYSVIPPEKIAESNARIRKHMKKKVKEYNKKMQQSLDYARRKYI